MTAGEVEAAFEELRAAMVELGAGLDRSAAAINDGKLAEALSEIQCLRNAATELERGCADAVREASKR